VVDLLEEAGERLVNEVAERAEARGVETVTEVVQGTPHRLIADYAATHAVDLVVMPTHGRTGLERLLLGSVTERTVRTCAVPVLTVRPDDETTYPYRRVLVATDGSPGSEAALDRAIAMAEASGAPLDVLSVVDTAALGPDVYSAVDTDRLSERAEAVVAAAAETATAAGVDVTGAVEYGVVHREIRAYAGEHDVDVLVVGTHGRTGFERYLLGSVAEKLVRSTDVPVLTVHAPEEEEEE
jgi:nucleotide-binding universal stress UspA family protein